MSKDPLGIVARMNAMSLMMITPEFYKIRRMRSEGAARISEAPARLEMKPDFIEVDGLNIRVGTSRMPDRPTVLFLSPLPQSILCYDAVWAKLSGHCDLIAVDLPGFGRSDGGQQYMSFDAQSAFLQKIMDVMALNDVHIVAPDVAMPVAMHHAIHRPEKVKSILIGDGPGIFPSADGSLIRKITKSGFWRTLVRLNGAKTFIAGALQLGYLHYSPTREEVEDYVKSYAGRIGQVTQYFKHYATGCAALTADIEKLNVPTQVFWGDEDGFLLVDNAHNLQARLPQGSVHVFENCGHFCYQDKSAEFAAMVRDWVEN